MAPLHEEGAATLRVSRPLISEQLPGRLDLTFSRDVLPQQVEFVASRFGLHPDRARLVAGLAFGGVR